MAENTYHPIGQPQPYTNGFFDDVPVPTPGYALILTSSRDQDPPLVIESGSVPEKRQVRRGQYNQTTRVDVSAHEISFELELPSADSISRFCVKLSMSARVRDPYQVMTNHVTDVAAAVRSQLTPRLEDLACEYALEQLQDLRRKILSSFSDVENLPCGISLSSISVQVRPDASHIRHQEQIQDLKNKEQYEIIRAGIADTLSQRYQDPRIQAFAEFAGGQITAEEAAMRMQKRSAKDFDESMRQYAEILNLVKQAQDMGLAPPEVLEEKTTQLLSSMVRTATANTPGLETGPAKKGLFSPPEDEDDDI